LVGAPDIADEQAEQNVGRPMGAFLFLAHRHNLLPWALFEKHIKIPGEDSRMEAERGWGTGGEKRQLPLRSSTLAPLGCK
jgi:hypothetical protein